MDTSLTAGRTRTTEALAEILDLVATHRPEHLRLLRAIVTGSPDYAGHLTEIEEQLDDEGPRAQYWETLQRSRTLDTLLAHPEQHPAQLMVCRDLEPTLQLCTAWLRRATTQEEHSRLAAVREKLARVVAMQQRAAERRARRGIADEAAVLSPVGAAQDEEG